MMDQSVGITGDLSEIILGVPPVPGVLSPRFILSSVTLPEFSFRLTYAPDQSDVAGKQLLGAALDSGVLGLVVNVHGDTMADLQTNRRDLEALFSQFAYTVTLDMQGELEEYGAFPTWPTWEIDFRAMIATATLSVPVNPIGA